MELNKHALNDAVAQELLTAQQAEQLWLFLSSRPAYTPRFQITNILYYMGGLIAIGAMTLLMNLGWERFGGWGLLVLACLYAVAGIALTEWLLHRIKQPVAAGNTAALVVVMAPLGIYGLQVAMGWWPEGMVYREYHLLIDWRWVFMELGTLICGAVMLWRYRLPFLVMPIAATLWYMSMDVAALVWGHQQMSWQAREMVSLGFGLGMLGLALWVDIRSRFTQDFAYWLYGFGAIVFWGALTSMKSQGLSQFSYLCINLLLIASGAVLRRSILVTLGGLGVTIYLFYLTSRVFANSLAFPFVLTAIGLSIIGAGILWQRHETAISESLRARLPKVIRELLEKND